MWVAVLRLKYSGVKFIQLVQLQQCLVLVLKYSASALLTATCSTMIIILWYCIQFLNVNVDVTLDVTTTNYASLQCVWKHKTGKPSLLSCAPTEAVYSYTYACAYERIMIIDSVFDRMRLRVQHWTFQYVWYITYPTCLATCNIWRLRLAAHYVGFCCVDDVM